MMEKSVVIIGAGLAGLSTGCFAQMNGYRSRILEQHTRPGGVAAAWVRGDYLIDGGIHFVMGRKPGSALHDLYRWLGVADADRFVEMTTYGRYVDEASGQTVEVTQDLERLESDLTSLSPGDGPVIRRLVAGARAMRGFDMSEIGMSKPPELLGPLDRIREMWGMRRLLRYFVGDYARPVADYAKAIQDPLLRACLEGLFLPEVPVYFLCMLLGLLADGQLGLLRDGCQYGFVRPIEKRYLDLGGQVSYRSTVEEIVVEDHRASAVRLTDGSEHRADYVVSAADGYSTIFEMLGGRYVNEEINRRYDSWELSRPLVTVSYGVARQFPDESPFVYVALARPIPVGGQEIREVFIRILNYGPRFAPPGKTLIQVEYESQWEYWNDLRQSDRSRYRAEKRRIAEQVLDRLELHYPGLSSGLEVTDVATPYTTWRYTLNRKAAWGGWLITPKTIMTRVERTLPGLRNFYMAGQWVMPGGGVPSCLYSGRHVAELLCRQEGRAFASAQF